MKVIGVLVVTAVVIFLMLAGLFVLCVLPQQEPADRKRATR